MDRTNFEELLAGFDPSLPIERAWTPPASWFTSPQIYELEQREVFGKSWQPVALVENFADIGSYQSGVVGRNPWVVVRGEDGQLRAFHNTCRHKGREVVRGSGRADELVCGYHAWTYGLDGRLRKAPRMAGVCDFDRKEMSLPPMALEVWGPWVFVNAELGSTPLAELVRPLDERLAKDWSKLKLVERASWSLKCNWKVVVDNYLDGGYHIPFMHPTLDAQLDMDSYKIALYEECSIQSSRSAQSRDERLDFDASDRIGGEALYMWLFPNFMINRYGSCMDTNHVIPKGPDECEVVYEFFFEETGGDEARKSIDTSIKQSAVTQREDIEICESVQLGLHSASYDRGRYAPQVEMGEYHFHQLLAARFRAGVAISR